MSCVLDRHYERHCAIKMSHVRVSIYHGRIRQRIDHAHVILKLPVCGDCGRTGVPAVEVVALVFA